MALCFLVLGLINAIEAVGSEYPCQERQPQCKFGCCIDGSGEEECCPAVVPIIGIIGVVVSINIVAVILAIVCCCRRKKDRQCVDDKTQPRRPVHTHHPTSNVQSDRTNDGENSVIHRYASSGDLIEQNTYIPSDHGGPRSSGDYRGSHFQGDHRGSQVSDDYQGSQIQGSLRCPHSQNDQQNPVCQDGHGGLPLPEMSSWRVISFPCTTYKIPHKARAYTPLSFHKFKTKTVVDLPSYHRNLNLD